MREAFAVDASWMNAAHHKFTAPEMEKRNDFATSEMPNSTGFLRMPKKDGIFEAKSRNTKRLAVPEIWR